MTKNKRWTKYNEERHNKKEPGKIQCVLCEGWYHKVCSHVVQKHRITSKEYKDLIGVSHESGIMSKRSKEIARKRVYENKEKSININLIEGGRKTRYIKKDTRIKKGKNKKPII